MRGRRHAGWLLLTAGGLAAARAWAQAPTFPSQVELITVDVVVVDGRGNPVRGLTRDDFVVEEDGRAQEIASFEAFVAEDAAPAATPSTPGPPPSDAPASNEAPAPQAGRAFALILDDLTLTASDAVATRRAVAAFLERSLRPGDEVSLATTSGDVWWSARLPEGREDLLAVAARVKGRFVEPTVAQDYMSEYEAFAINTREGQSGGTMTSRVITRWENALICDPRARMSCEGLTRMRATSIDGARRQRVRVALGAVRRGLEALAPVRGRKSLLLWSRGFLEDVDTEVRDVVAASREANTAVYFLDVRGLQASAPGTQADTAALPSAQEAGAAGFEARVLESAGAQALAEDTGGRSVRNTNDLAAGADRVAAESRVFYLLGFHPPPGKGPREWRKLKVRVTRDGLEVRSRRGYTVPAAAAPEAKRPEGGKGEPTRAVAGALDSAHPMAGIPIRALAYVLEPRPKDTTRVLVAAEFDTQAVTFERKGKDAVARLELSVAAIPRDGARVQLSGGRIEVRVAEGERPGWRALTREFELPAGVAQARVVLRDLAGPAMGSVSQRFEVPAPGTLRLSTPILTDRAAGGDGQGPVQPALSVHRVFRPQGRLYCQYQVYGAARAPGQALPQVVAGLELRTADGRVVLKAAPTRVAADPDGRVVRLVGIPLDGLAAGVYDLRLEVQDEVSGGRVERREAFRLDAEGK